jgi:MFS transporter, PAT family, beta-lactamase induction signal transducer AmpG
MTDTPSLAERSTPLGPTWQKSLAWYIRAPSLRMLALGFTAGVPLLLVLGTFSFRLREAGVELSTIGFLSWVSLAYAFKWVWAPVVDHQRLYVLTDRLGRRRAWLLLAQCALIGGLLFMAFTSAEHHLSALVMGAIFVALASATQDIALDAYRIESASLEHQAALAAMYQTGYRLGMIWSGAGALWIASKAQGLLTPNSPLTPHEASQLAWQTAYTVMACSIGVGVMAALWAPEAPCPPSPKQKDFKAWLHNVMWAPFKEFFSRFTLTQALTLLALIGVYRISDLVMGVMANPFYVDMGFSKEEIAWVSKIFGVLMTLLGAFLGGALTQRYGVLRVLMWGAMLSATSNVLFAWLSGLGHHLGALIGVISVDNLSAGIAQAAFVAFLSSLTRVQFSASQYAMLSATVFLLPQSLAGFSGVAVQAVGYFWFFIGTALLGLPVLLLIRRVQSLGLVASPHVQSPD